MKIALFTETYLPHINGVVTHVHSLRLGLEKLGHQVLVVCADSRTQRHYVKDGVLHCPGRYSKKFYGFTLSKPYSKERQRLVAEFNPDVIHIHTEFGIGYAGRKMAKRLGKPLVYTLHTMYDEYVYYIAPKPLLGLGRAFAHKYIGAYAKAADAITGPSKKCQEYIDLIGVNKPVMVVPNPVDLDLFRPETIHEADKEAVLQQHRLQPDWTIATFVGRLGKEKSADLLLEYWAQTVKPQDNMHLLIIGDGPEMPALQALVQKLGAAGTVTFAGRIDHEKLPPYYGVCQLYVTASLSDTNSISMLEGMAFGLPVLQRFDRLNEDQVVEGVNGFVYDSPETFKAKLDKVRGLSPEQRAALAAGVRQSVQSKGCDALGANLLKVYQQVILQKAAK